MYIIHAYACTHTCNRGMILRAERTFGSKKNSKIPSGRLRFSIWLKISEEDNCLLNAYCVLRTALTTDRQLIYK